MSVQSCGAVPETCPTCAAELPRNAAFCPTCGTATQPVPSSPSEDLRRRLQRAIGRGYELGELLGGGGFGEVYAARDVRLDREVAVKTLRIDVANGSEMIARFRREARAMAKLRHPHIVPIYSVGESRGLAYLIMPRIVGETLRDRIVREAQLPFRETHRILRELAMALEAAHVAGVVHRDLKPENILLEGEEQRVLLTDFGIARPAVETEAPLTMTGVLLGTPQYMSPEQAAGEPHVGPASDIYSLGVVAFEMLTGRTPFRSTSVLGLLAQQLRQDAPRVGDLRAGCPPDLAGIVDRCLEREPETRWESASALLLALTSGQSPGVEPGVRGLPMTPHTHEAAPTLIDPRRRFAWSVALVFGVTLAAFALDEVLNGAIDFAPFVAAAAVLFLLLEFGLLEASLRARAARATSATLQDPLVQRAATERAAIVSVASRVTSAERTELADVLSAVDATVARAASLASRIDALDRAIAAAHRRLEREAMAADAVERAHRVEETMGERERRATHEAESSRTALEAELEECVDAIHEVRTMLSRDGSRAAEPCLERLSAALAVR